MGAAKKMNIGKVDPELEKFVGQYKRLGYSTKTELANDAFRLLKRSKAAEARKRWRAEAAKEKEPLKVGKAWEDIDGEDFE
jgi:hypothetical protein